MTKAYAWFIEWVTTKAYAWFIEWVTRKVGAGTFVRSYFTEVLGWEDGVEFQYLASQNTMASLIGGLTLHHWSTIPVNATKAQEKKMGKGAEGDVNALFLKVQGMRWLVIDKVSTASP